MRAAVVLVVRDDDRVHSCLEALAGQRVEEPFDVVVVDNDSQPTFAAELERRWGSRPRVRVLREGGSFAGAWNRGALGLDVDVVARLDADTIPDPDWLERLIAPMALRADMHWTAGAVHGPTPPRSLTQRYFHHRTLGYQRRLEGERLPTDAVPSWNVAYRLSALRTVGGYDPWQRSSVDWDLHKRLSRAGFAGVFVPDAVLVHDHPATLRGFYRKEAWYRTGQYQMMLKYGPGALAESLVLPAVYVLLAALGAAGVFDARLGVAAAVLALALLVKQWVSAALEGDAVWWARPLYRIVEAAAAFHGLLRGLVTFGVRKRPIPGATA